eukprot:jgi/Picsp_1/3120/NSC_05961-R1_protein
MAETQKLVSSLYRAMNAIENNIGGGEGVEGLYGSIRGASMEKILQCMKEKCNLNDKSHLMDVGSGLCRPLVHAIVTAQVVQTTGVEIDRIKCMKAEAFCSQMKRQLYGKKYDVACTVPMPEIRCSSIEDMESLDPATHAYSFWEGVPVDARVRFGRLFSTSKTLTSLAVVQRSMRKEDPAEEMDALYGFGALVLVGTFPVSMSGSGRNFMAYIFNKAEEAETRHRQKKARKKGVTMATILKQSHRKPTSITKRVAMSNARSRGLLNL